MALDGTRWPGQPLSIPVSVPPRTPEEQGQRARRRAQSEGPSGKSLAKEFGVWLLVALVLSWLLKTFLLQVFFIPSGSMEDTLQVGDRVVVNELVPGPFDLHRGDIVVFRDSAGWLAAPATSAPSNPIIGGARNALQFIGLLPDPSDEHLIKRVIGLPGDTVSCCDAQGRLMVNGKSIDETYLKPGEKPSMMNFQVTVPVGSLWVMGDNRGHSGDSRFHQNDGNGGFVPIDEVVGVAFAIVWPLDRATILSNPGDVFSAVSSP